LQIQTTPEGVWNEYQNAVSYNQSIGLYENVKKNENFFLGRQWEGVNAPDLDKPVLNFLRRVCSYMVSMLVTDDIGVSINPFEGTGEPIYKAVSRELERVMEKTKFKSLCRDFLRDAIVDGDGFFYTFFDADTGEIQIERLDNTNVLFGNPFVAEIERQPYILVAKRMLLSQAKEYAKARGAKDWQSITPDDENLYINEDEQQSEQSLVTVLMKFYRHPQTGRIHYLSCTQSVEIDRERDTGLARYPFSCMRWEKVKNCYHGEAAITGLIPNQIFVNKLFAMSMQHVKMNAFPKVIFDRTKIRRWTNKVGEAIEVVGNPNDAFAASFKVQDMSDYVMVLIDKMITYTRDFMGASDAALGNVKPDNTSAIIAVQKASSAPLELQKLSFYQAVEDTVRNIIDCMAVSYGVRPVTLETEQGNMQVPVDFGALGLNSAELNVDIGASAYWSELMQVQTLDNLFTRGIITDAVTYLEGIPDAYIKNKQKIIEKLKEQQAAAQSMQMLPGMGGENRALPQV
jgi:hypothetical protein